MSGWDKVLPAARRAWVQHPRWSLAARGAFAATLAWLVGGLVPEPFSEYPYYAPLGAVIATTSTVARSVRDSFQATLAVLFGAVLARVVDLLPLPGTLSIATVVGLALLCVRWRVFGPMGEWVVNSAIFLLIIGHGGDGTGFEYLAAYVGLIVVGALIGIGVNLLLPPLPLTLSEIALNRLRDGLVDQIDELATWLEHHGPLALDEWERRRRELFPTIERAREEAAHARESARGNRRVRRYSRWLEDQWYRAGALATAAEVVDDVVQLLVEWEHEGRDSVALGPELRPAVATVLRAFATALRPTAEDAEDDADEAVATEAGRSFADAVDELRDILLDAQRSSQLDHFVAGALVVTLGRAAHALRT